MAETVTVEVLGWDKFNGRGDVKKSSWFRLEHSLIDNPEFYTFSHEERWAWIYILSLASRKNSAIITINYEHAQRVSKLSRKGIDGAIRKLTQLGCVHADVTGTVRGRNVDVPLRYDTLRDETLRNDTNATRAFDFSAIWEKYPRKIAKTNAQDRFQRVIRSEEDFERLQKAMERFRDHHAAKGTEERYIPHMTTFLGTESRPSWRDWLDPQNGTSDITPKDKDGKAILPPAQNDPFIAEMERLRKESA